MPQDDRTDRELICGELREQPMSYRDYAGSICMVNVGCALQDWLEKQPEPRRVVLMGDAGFILRHNPDTLVGIDVAYIAPGLAAQTPEGAPCVNGAPVLAVEILSPSNTHAEVAQKISEYLDCGVHLVWVLDPTFKV